MGSHLEAASWYRSRWDSLGTKQFGLMPERNVIHIFISTFISISFCLSNLSLCHCLYLCLCLCLSLPHQYACMNCIIMNAWCINRYGQHRATQCSQTLLLSSAHAASLHDYVHQLMAQCIRRQRHKPRTAYGEVATWLNILCPGLYCIQSKQMTADHVPRLAMFDSHSASHSESFVCRQKPCHGRSWRRDRASVFQPWLVSHSTFFLPRSTAAEAISTALLLVCFSQRLQ